MASNDTVTDESCVTRTVRGVLTGVLVAAVGAGTVVAFRGPSARLSPIQSVKQLFGVVGPAAAMAGGLFGFTECTVEVTRNRTDMWNAAIGGCVAGATVGLHRKSLGSTAFGCLAFGAAAGLTDVNKYMFAPPQQIAQERKHPDIVQTTPESLDRFAAGEFGAANRA